MNTITEVAARHTSLEKLIGDYSLNKFTLEDLKTMKLDSIQPFVSKKGNRITWKSNNETVIAKAKIARGEWFEVEFEYHLNGEHLESCHAIGK